MCSPSVLGLFVLAVELDGCTQWVLTSDVSFARRQLTEAGGTEIEELDPLEVVCSQYGDLAVLSTFG